MGAQQSLSYCNVLSYNDYENLTIELITLFNVSKKQCPSTYNTDFSSNEATQAIIPLNVELDVFCPPHIFACTL